MPRRALITGASAGLGVEFANQLAAAKVDLLLVARRKDKLEEVAAQVRQDHGVDVAIFPADLSDRNAPRELFDFAQDSGLEIDYLINNAGSAGPNLLEEPEWAPQAAFLELMMISAAHLCHYFIPPMKSRAWGRVINVASFAGRIARPAGAHYGPSKAYLIALSEELALMLRGTGVHVSALCPGFTHTDFHSVAGLDEMKSALPGLIWYDAETVVREGLEAVEKNKPIYVSGRIYRWLDPLTQSVFVRPLIKALAPGR